MHMLVFVKHLVLLSGLPATGEPIFRNPVDFSLPGLFAKGAQFRNLYILASP